MRNIELECMPGWRYCIIPRGKKGPQYAEWHVKPYTLDQIPNDSNLGLLLGAVSGGVCAIDFDGPAAWDWWDKNIGIDMPTTIAWASGRVGRCQMAFSVPEIAWPYLETKKINLGVPCPEDPKKSQGWEFRWGNDRGIQSVLPPSLHPETGQEYFWVHAPSQTDLVELPDAVIEWLIMHKPTIQVEQDPLPEISIDDVKEDDYNHVIALLEQLKNYRGRLDYECWRNLAYSVAWQLGAPAAELALKQIWPEERRGEYRMLLKNYNRTLSPPLEFLEKLVMRHAKPNRKINNNNQY